MDQPDGAETTRFGGFCDSCGYRYLPGTRAYRVDGRLRHASCVTAESERTNDA